MAIFALKPGSTSWEKRGQTTVSKPRNRGLSPITPITKGDAVELEQAAWAVQQAAVFVNAMRAGFMPGAGSIDEA